MSEFVSYLHEVFASFGSIESKRMFGGYGIYHQGLMFGLVADDALYLKADTLSRNDFDSRGLLAFEFIKQGKATQMSYFAAPESIFDDPDEAAIWAERGYQAAVRAIKPNKRSR
ncbi:MAG: TfoX/Sxy family protein [Pseudomarimonas sp.]